MKYISNIHTHTTYCDGKNTIEENILIAINKGFISIGFSGHSHFDYDISSMSVANTIKYLEDIKKCKEVYKDKIEVYAGIEGDYYSNLSKDTDIEMGLDYRIGSVHFIEDDEGNYYPIDNSEDKFIYALNYFSDIKEIAKRYYNNIIKMINTQKPDIIGHLDLIRKYNKNNKYFNVYDNWHIDLIDNVLLAIKDYNKNNGLMMIEINTGKVKEDNLKAYYPNDLTIKRILELDIPIIVNTDCHVADRLDNYYIDMIDTLREVGFSSVKMLINNNFIDVEI